MALSLNGTSQILDIGNVPTITGPLVSLSLWFYPTQATSLTTLACLGVDSARYQFRTGNAASSTANITAQVVDGVTNPPAISGNTYTQNAWNHGFGSFNSTTERIRLNGGTAVTASVGTVTPITKTSVGGRFVSGVPGNFFAGRVAEFAVWNEVLTSDEEVALSQGFSPLLIRPGKLVRYWPLIREAQDLKGATPVTLTGSPSVVDHPRILMR